MKRLIVLAVLILVGTASWAQNIMGTGQWLHDGWLADQKYKDGRTMEDVDIELQGMFIGFVLGASTVMEEIRWLDIPTGTTGGQKYALVGKYLDDHPEQWNVRAEVLIYRALHAVWPGSKSPPPPQ